MEITDPKTYVAMVQPRRDWIFVELETDEGITGWGECSDGRSPHGIEGPIEDLKPILIGQDPRAFEMRFWDMYRSTFTNIQGRQPASTINVSIFVIFI